MLLFLNLSFTFSYSLSSWFLNFYFSLVLKKSQKFRLFDVFGWFNLLFMFLLFFSFFNFSGFKNWLKKITKKVDSFSGLNESREYSIVFSCQFSKSSKNFIPLFCSFYSQAQFCSIVCKGFPFHILHEFEEIVQVKAANLSDSWKNVLSELPFYENVSSTVYPPGKYLMLCLKGSGPRPGSSHLE